MHGSVIGFFTKDSFYELEAKRMARSAELVGLTVDLTPVESVGTWVRNAGLKAKILLSKRTELRGPLLYVDVDAVFRGDPWPLLASFACDLGVHVTAKGELLSGTILINDTPAALDVLGEWSEILARGTDEWDQVVLERVLTGAVKAGRATLASLPNTLCWITDNTAEEPDGDILIEHLQASREINDTKRLFGRTPGKLKRRRKRIEELDKMLWK